jgi:hypothetical protein
VPCGTVAALSVGRPLPFPAGKRLPARQAGASMARPCKTIPAPLKAHHTAEGMLNGNPGVGTTGSRRMQVNCSAVCLSLIGG